MTSSEYKRVIILGSITSDIGTSLAEKYSKGGNNIIGTYRSEKSLNKLKKISNCELFYCDLENEKSINKFTDEYRKLNTEWDTFISCAFNPLPLKSFFDSDFQEWNNSFHTNSIEQLRILHNLYPMRRKDKVSNVIFFAGGGSPNRPAKNISAYNSSRIMLTRMCELLDAENEDMNIFIVGPGWTKTKGHRLILRNLDKSDERYEITKKFLQEKKGTSIEDIFNCIEWLCKKGKKTAGGRNFSVVHDVWGDEKLAEILERDPNLYRLRRFEG